MTHPQGPFKSLLGPKPVTALPAPASFQAPALQEASISIPQTQRAVLAGVGVHLRAVQGDRAQFEHAHLARQEQNLHEQPFDLLEEPPPECSDGVVIGVLVRRDEAESHRVVGCRLHLRPEKTPVA